jgi:ferrochelatase
VAAVCPGFTVDCLETIDEIGHEGKIAFQKAGGEDLRLLPCLNAHPSWIRALAEMSRQELQGWD